MIDIKLLGPKDSQYALLSDKESGAWLATCWGEHAQAVKEAIAAIANNSHQRESVAKELPASAPAKSLPAMGTEVQQPTQSDSHPHLCD